MPNQRKTIAVLIDHIDQLSHGYESQLRWGFMRACSDLDINLLIVAGRALRAPEPWGAPRNGVYELLHANCVNGLILMSNGIIGGCTIEELQEICRGYSPLPLCSAGLAIPGVPSVVIDNRPGMDALIEHLIVEHDRHQIAFLGGPKENPDAQLRLAVYRDVLARHGISFDPALVAIGALTRNEGRKAMEDILARGVTFDAVVGVNDAMAMGAAEVLAHRGRAGGQELSLVGFDDLALARLVNPPLTTVRQPLDEMASLAVRLLVDQMCGREVPPLTSLSARLTMRESCGCTPSQRRPSQKPRLRSAAVTLKNEQERLLDLIQTKARLPHDGGLDAARVLLDGLQAELDGSPHRFVQAVERVAGWIEQSEEQYEELQKVISLLRNELYAFSRPGLEDVWDEARRTVAFANTRRQAQRLMEVDLTYRHLLTTSEHFSSTLDLSDLKRCVADELREMGVQNAVICLYVEEDKSLLSPFLCLKRGQVYEPRVEAYEATELFPPGAWPADARHTSFVLPLTVDARQIGVAVFEFTAGLRVHDMLCEQIAGAIHTARLHRQIVQKTTLHERALQERRAAAERMKSLSVLAGGVAHDLNNALGPLLTLPTIMSRELSDTVLSGSPDAEQLRADLMTIHSAALRASQTIKDLLTLGRQGRTQLYPVDLNQVISSWQSSPSANGSGPRDGVVVKLDLHGQPLVVKASEAHVVRALANLVQNAVEALEEGGVVRIETGLENLSEPHVGYEVIAPGQYAVLRVCDTGMGIARDLGGRLFEPFVTTKRISGSSGSGLGLAVVHGVVKEHNGFIDVRSEDGQGTTFSLYFPVSTEAPRRVAPVSTPPRGTGRVLVVDDDPVQLTTTRRVLCHLGYSVTTALSGQKAYQLLSSVQPSESTGSAGPMVVSQFDVIIIDVMLNEAVDGIDLLAQILELFPDQRALLTSGQAPEAAARGAEPRGIGWLAKPFTVHALAKAVQELLDLDMLDSNMLGSNTEEPRTDPAVQHSFTAMLRTGPGSLLRSTAVGSDGGKRR